MSCILHHNDEAVLLSEGFMVFNDVLVVQAAQQYGLFHLSMDYEMDMYGLTRLVLVDP